MAKARMGAIVSSVTGSIGGLTFSTTPQGQIIRRRPAKTTKETFGLQRYRARFANAAHAYAALTAAQRAGWETLANDLNSKATPGMKRWMNGREVFLSEALVNARVGLALPTAAPTRRQRPFWATTTISWTGGSLLCTYAAASGQAAGSYIMEGCRAMSEGGFSAKLFRIYIFGSYGSGGTLNWTSIFNTNTGTPNVGEYFALRIRTRETNGLFSLPYEWRGKRIS